MTNESTTDQRVDLSTDPRFLPARAEKSRQARDTKLRREEMRIKIFLAASMALVMAIVLSPLLAKG
jgi:hypothetical protein